MRNITSKIVIEDLESLELQELTSTELEKVIGAKSTWYYVGRGVGWLSRQYVEAGTGYVKYVKYHAPTFGA